jgi:hypothetical protein
METEEFQTEQKRSQTIQMQRGKRAKNSNTNEEISPLHPVEESSKGVGNEPSNFSII